MDVRIQADAIAISRALIAALLFVGERTGCFSEVKFDQTELGSVPKRRRTHRCVYLAAVFKARRAFKRSAFSLINPVASPWSYVDLSPSIVAILGSYKLFGLLRPTM